MKWKCNNCQDEVTITTPHEQELYRISHLCPTCRDKVIEESYRDQPELKCCRQCDFHDWTEESLVCGKTYQEVMSTAICAAFKAMV